MAPCDSNSEARSDADVFAERSNTADAVQTTAVTSKICASRPSEDCRPEESRINSSSEGQPYSGETGD